MAKKGAQGRTAAARPRSHKKGPTRTKPHASRTGVLHISARGSGMVQTPDGAFLITAHNVGEAMDGDTVQVRSLGRSRAADKAGALEGAICGVVERATTSFAARYVRDGRLRVLVLQTPDGAFLITAHNVGEAMDGDTVQVRSLGRSRVADKAGALEGAICGVVERATTSFAARYVRDGRLRVLVPLNERLAHDFVIDHEDNSDQLLGVSDGEAVVARILAYPSRRAAGVATIERRIGSMEAESLPIEAIVAEHGLATEFSPDVLAQAQSIVVDVEQALASEPLRRDIRDRFLVTVDPADARDFDDAVSIEPLPQGGWLLGVHIADVSHYVTWDSPIDLEARSRGTSVYLPDRVLPMLPEQLCNDVCSLRPDEDRLAMTCDLTLDRRGRVTGCEIYPSVIRSKARLCYSEVDDLLDNIDDKGILSSEYSGNIADMAHFFCELNKVSELRQHIRFERGAIEFVTTEARARLNSQGHAIGIDLRKRTRATALIEEAMLAANEAVARYLERHATPAPFRVHEPPAAESLAMLAPKLKNMLDVDNETRAGVLRGEPAALQKVLAKAQGHDNELVVSAVTLRAMTRAVYLPENRGHFGLGAQSYCHFTSPIRRYPDLMVHRVLKAQLAGKMRGSLRHEMEEAMPTICSHSSKMERVAAEASAQSQDVKMAQYLGDHLGKAWSGLVMGVTSYGLFVQLDDIGAQGLLHVRELGGWCDLDDETGELVDQDSGKHWRLGQRVAVYVKSVDVARGYVNLALVR